MSKKFIISQDETFGKTMGDIADHATETGAPVMFPVENKGDFVMMTSDAYADLIDQTQTVDDVDFACDDLLSEIVSEQES